ncbi:MAG: class I SAM-dependent methyltransferase [candidate division Zixibacteria bacterium]|nr:class I SAM-dependent methyltransferase [candidate division Zixibacteria bacterium]
MDLRKITESNREAWNQASLIHQKNRKLNLREEFAKPGFSTLDQIETEALMKIGLDGKAIAQLSCNNGRETLSLVNLGAESAVGFDISDEAIKEAKNLREVSGLNCKFVRTDVYDIGEEYFGKFDLVYISIGALCWLPDLAKFFELVSAILKSDGQLFIYEAHPVLNMIAETDESEFDSENPFNVCCSYFKKEPWITTTGLDYIGGTKYDSKPSYSFSQPLGDILNGIISNGITIKSFTEYGHDISESFKHLEKDNKLPMSYILTGEKSAN